MSKSEQLRAALGHTMNIVVLTDERGKELVAPVFKQILELREQGVPEETVNALLDSLKRCCHFNASVSVEAQTVCNILDELARAQHGPLAIKSIARTLRPALKVLADPHRHSAGEYVIAVRTVDDLAARAGRARLLSGSMRHELRSRAFGTLTAHLPRADGVGGVAGHDPVASPTSR